MNDLDNIITHVAFHFSVWTYSNYDHRELARRLYLSYKSYINPPTDLLSDTFLYETEDMLKPVPQLTEEEEEREFLDNIMDGTIGKKKNNN